MKKSATQPRSLCAIVPAAGRGSRLGIEEPKVFVSLTPSLTIWEAIRGKLSTIADQIVLVLSPEGCDFLASDSTVNLNNVKIAVQPEPLGMGDAIFGAADLWREFDDLIIVWGDQFNLSAETLRACVELHGAQKGPALTLPMVRILKPYVEYIFDSGGHLTTVRQSREEEGCTPGGLADMGVFLLSGGVPLFQEWERYRAQGNAGSVTGEINFLPFLVHLSQDASWNVARYEGGAPHEALGINTPDDLALARRLLQKGPSSREESS